MSEAFNISIPCDNDGFFLLRCPKCGEYFKLIPSEFQDDAVENISCPQCGLMSDNYLTQDVINLAMAKTTNMASDMLDKTFKELERSTRNSMIKFKTTKVKKADDESNEESTPKKDVIIKSIKVETFDTEYDMPKTHEQFDINNYFSSMLTY